MSASLFPSLRRQWENQLDLGATFFQHAKDNNIPKKYLAFMTLSRQKDKDRIAREKKRNAKIEEMQS